MFGKRKKKKGDEAVIGLPARADVELVPMWGNAQGEVTINANATEVAGITYPSRNFVVSSVSIVGGAVGIWASSGSVVASSETLQEQNERLAKYQRDQAEFREWQAQKRAREAAEAERLPEADPTRLIDVE